MRTRGGLAVAAAVGLALAACGPKDADSDTAPASTPPAATVEQPQGAPARPIAFSFAETTPDAEVKLTVDKAIGRWPVLHRRLYDSEVGALRTFAAEAKTDRAGMAGEDGQPPPYADEVTWTVAAHSARLVSLERTEYVFTGGAHPNHGFDSMLWDIRERRPVEPPTLFTTGDDTAIDKALCDGLAAEKKARDTFADWDRESWPCPGWRKARFVLAPSTEPGKFGGVVFLFAPYEAGPYAEGAYTVSLPWTVFRGVLAPAYAAEFAGGLARPRA